MKTSDIKIIPIKHINGFVGLVTGVFDGQIHYDHMAIYSCPLSSHGFSVVHCKEEVIYGKTTNSFHPSNKKVCAIISLPIIKKYKELMDDY